MSDATIVESLFFAALEKSNPAERADYLASACGGDLGLRRQVDKLLRAHARMGVFLTKPAAVQFAGELTQSDIGDPQRDTLEDCLNFLTPARIPGALGRVGHYLILEALGRGGCGTVFRAMDEVLQREVAIKVLAPQLAANAAARESFLAEARSVAKIRHPNVVQVFAVEEERLPFLVMELIPGENLLQRVNRKGRLDALEVARIGQQVAAGLAASHRLGFVHRDVKPENILLECCPTQLPEVVSIKIGDFGLARAFTDVGLSQFGIVAGTPLFMSPEQAQGVPLDHRSDLFSLGSVLYTMCCGETPFQAKSTFAVLRKVVEDSPKPIRDIAPETPEWLCEIITRLHAKRPEDRFASAQEVAEILGKHLAKPQYPEVLGDAQNSLGQTVASTPATAGRVASKLQRWKIAAAALLLIGILGFSEMTGVTNLFGTAIRLFTPEGTLIVEIDDPKVSVSIEGSDVVVAGAGVNEIRLKVGRYAVTASKDGKPIQRELVSVTNSGRPIVRISQEVEPVVSPQEPPHETTAVDTEVWKRSLATLPRPEQTVAVVARLKLLNPGYAGKSELETHDLDFTIEGDDVRDLSPVRELPWLRSLYIRSKILTDLSPLSGLGLHRLVLNAPSIANLSPLSDIELWELDLSGCTKLQDLSALKGMSLQQLTIAATSVRDLTPLADMKLTYLNCGGSGVTDLGPLKGMPLTGLKIDNTRVSNLAALEGMPLEHLSCNGSLVNDESLNFLKACKTLKYLSLKGARVTAAGAAALKMTLPDCEIEL